MAVFIATNGDDPLNAAHMGTGTLIVPVNIQGRSAAVHNGQRAGSSDQSSKEKITNEIYAAPWGTGCGKTRDGI